MRENSRPSKSGADVAYYPLLLDISKKPCLVVGGGLVAERKVRMLLKFDARVVLVSPKVKKSLLRLAEKGSIEVMEREYCEGDLEGASLEEYRIWKVGHPRSERFPDGELHVEVQESVRGHDVYLVQPTSLLAAPRGRLSSRRCFPHHRGHAVRRLRPVGPAGQRP